MKKILILVSTLIIASHAVVAFSQGEAAGGKVIIKKDLILHNRANSDAEIRDKRPIRKHDWSTSLRRGKYNKNGIKTIRGGGYVDEHDKKASIVDSTQLFKRLGGQRQGLKSRFIDLPANSRQCCTAIKCACHPN